jgi:Zn-dependent M28 family amino/carboxypeptidase
MDNMPCCLIDTESFNLIEKWQKQGKEIEAEFSIKTRYAPNSILRNVIAEKKSSSGKEIIISAHYDSVPESPGANDNASGTLALLALAEKFSEKACKHTIKLISFDAEEWNKLGAYMYVEGLRQNLNENKINLDTKTSKYLRKQTALDRIKAVINIDTIGAGKTIYCIADKKYVGIIKSSAKKTRQKVELRQGYNSPQFDGWPFHLEGIPIIHFGVYPYKYFHTPQDTKEKVEPKLVDGVTGLVEKIADSIDKY